MMVIHPFASKKQDRRGAAAVEFAFVALPFFFLLLGLLEIGILLLVSAMVDTATSDASRLIRTGQAQLQQLTPDAIKNRFCANLSIFNQDCAHRTDIDIRVVKTFTGEIAPNPLATGAFDRSVLAYEPGQPGDYILVRIWFEHPVFTPFMAKALSRSTDKKIRLQTTLAFRNEPYL